MLGFQTLSCLHEIPVVRSSTNKIQDAYHKAKNTNTLIRLSCDLAETVADKSLKVALTVANPLVKPFSGPVRAIDDYAAEKLRQIEAKYPVLKAPTENVLNSINEKTEPVRHVMNSFKDTTTTTLQQGRETVSQVASATVNKATDVADSVYTFCETHVPGKTSSAPRNDFGRRTTLLWERIQYTFGSLRTNGWDFIRSLIIWSRMFIVFMLMKIKQVNDHLLIGFQRIPVLSILPQRFSIIFGATLDFLILRIRPDDRTVIELNKTKEQPRFTLNKRPQTPQFVSRQTMKPDAFITTRQSVVTTSQETKVTCPTRTQPTKDCQNIYPTIPTGNILPSPPVEAGSEKDIEKLHDKIKPTPMELLYARLPADVTMIDDPEKLLTNDQQLLHIKLNSQS